MNAQTEHLGVFRYEYADGLAYEVRCDSETSLHWRCTAGDEQGREGTEVIDRVALRPRQHLLSWTEVDGLSVTQVIDYAEGRVDAVLVPKEGDRIVFKSKVSRVGS
jgi:phenolic acid decarboxylase